MKGVISRVGLAHLAGCLPLLLTLSAGAVNVTFDGELLDTPCQIDSASLNQTVQFLERPAKDFQYAPGRGRAEDFSIRLIQCNTNTIWKTVKLKFNGDKESAMKELSEYFLKVTGVNTGKLAIGILDTDGTTLMKLGSAHNRGQGTPINRETLQFNFKAYVQATPDALAQKSVTPGDYASTANFELFYE
ncbi:TPA: type 1 fimbrial protein [Salmonella enterica subsp. enterica serovar Mississippi]|nr:type 1 fimbrial protein [Salmonella enterica subsp. enterica]ECW0788953.1 type 1 fimbrial protein [Salmonella enterica subsp. enterica]HED0168014.1 type 1 fimbrial protein [Salmonella enterica subsp. enterica serovar Mississippi]HED0173878.1 type 1 fimbrial protein [Salmonella enterica subsp. enterica serovar Mississippi]HED0195873.1 type 1 fimbrial protein [Salmonella enterica subsp. enterica serovar Mississippi]